MFNIFVFQNEQNYDFSPNKLSHSSTSSQFGQKHRSLVQQRSTPANLGSRQTKFQTPRIPDDPFVRQISQPIKPQLQRSIGVGGYVDHLTGDNRLDSFGRDSSLGMFLF